MTRYPTLDPSGIAECVNAGLNPWFIKLRFQSEKPIEGRVWNEVTEPSSSIQTKIGNEFEEDVYNWAFNHADRIAQNWFGWNSMEENRQKRRNLEQLALETGDTILLLQSRFKGEIKNYTLTGDADLIALIPNGNNLDIHVYDMKSTWEKKTHHQLQVSIYANLYRQEIENVENYQFHGHVVHREESFNSLTDFSEFELSSRENDVYRLLDESGPFETAFSNQFEELPLKTDSNDAYTEVYNVYGVEEKTPAILGLSSGELKKLEKYDITTLEDLAELYHPPENPKPITKEDPEIVPKYEDKVKKIDENGGITERMALLSQKAQSYLSKLNPDHPHAWDENQTPWLQNTGTLPLPEDDPQDTSYLSYPSQSLIRVYLNVQHDSIRDEIIGVSATITSTKSDKKVSFANISSDISQNPTEWKTNEEELLEKTIEELYEGIRTVSSEGYLQQAIHFYTFTESEIESLDEGLERWNENEVIQSLREYTGMRAGIEQEMFTAVKPIIDEHLAIPHKNQSIPVLVNELNPYEEKEQFGSWGELKDKFEYRIFDSYYAINTGENVNVLNENGSTSSQSDNFMSLTPREGSQIPLEYFWIVSDAFTVEDVEEGSEELVYDYETFKTEEGETKHITEDDLLSLIEKFSQALGHIERGLSYRDLFFEKEPIELDSLEDYDSSETLREACRDYLQLEHHTAKEETEEHYQQPLKERIRVGKSVPIELDEIIEDEGYKFTARGSLLYDEMDFENPEQIARCTRVKGSDGVSSGSWMIANPLSDSLQEMIDYGNQIHQYPQVTVKSISPRNGNIIIEGFKMSTSSDFMENRMPWTTDRDGQGIFMGNGEKFVLDPNPDDLNSQKAMTALDAVSSNPIYNLIRDIRNGNENLERDEPIDIPDEYFDLLDEELPYTPNRKQEEFICETDSKVSLLQGPPGTGKTNGALAHAIIGRMFAYENEGENFSSLITGASNKAVNEALEDVSQYISALDLDVDVELVRLVLDSGPEDGLDNVTYFNYHDDNATALRNRLHGQTTFSSSTRHTIVFATPGRVEGLAGKMFDMMDSKQVYRRAIDFFDVVASDEASMITLPQLFLTTPFLDEEGQLLLVGDHRQMPPVQQHEWEEETRPSITSHVPFLSGLNYFRWLSGEDVERVNHLDSLPSYSVDIPIVGLEQTYRCHTQVADFLQETVYSRDDIEYTSEQEETMSELSDSVPDGIREILNPDDALTVVVHDDITSRQSNETEATILNAITSHIPEQESVGMVTPHNAQKGLLNTVCDTGVIDTVERFQGGEQDVMLVSATVSDPDYLDTVSDFVLSLNRLNVALSRMKKKLVVIVPKSIFETIPEEPDEYVDATIWKRLYTNTAQESDPLWHGSVKELTNGFGSSNTKLSVYNI